MSSNNHGDGSKQAAGAAGASIEALDRELRRIYVSLFPGARPLSLNAFGRQDPEHMLLMLEQSLGDAAPGDALHDLERQATALVNLGLDVLENLAGDEAGAAPVRLFLSRMMYVRAFVLVQLGQFCEAAQETREAVLVLRRIAAFRDDPARIYCTARIMFQGLMNSVFAHYYTAAAYTPSDCLTTCAYCQDPISTLAQQGAKSLAGMEESAAVRERINSVWAVAAAMLAAYTYSRGGDPLAGHYPASVEAPVKLALRVMLRDDKTAGFPWLDMVRDYRLILEN